jgi:ABC-2 type transport system permease protein
MMVHLRLIGAFARASAQGELAYRTNFLISLLHTGLNLGTGILALQVVFGQVDAVNGWDFPATLALLGVYLTLSALRGLFIGPSLEALAGMDGEIWTGKFDFTLLRPVDVQFQATFRHWRPLALTDLALGLAVLGIAAASMDHTLSALHVASFLVTLGAGVMILYAILLAFSALVFWSPGFLFTWVFDGLYQMARYPVQVYPGWLRIVLTWIVPVGVMTTVPAQALSGTLSWLGLLGGTTLAMVLFLGTSALFRYGLRRYASASS